MKVAEPSAAEGQRADSSAWRYGDPRLSGDQTR
jgi:hypothetical protein